MEERRSWSYRRVRNSVESSSVLFMSLTRWPSRSNRHFTVRSIFEFDTPSRQRPGDGANPWATSCALMYCKLDVETMESVEVSASEKEGLFKSK